MLEKCVEEYLKQEVESARGGKCIKIDAASEKGLPDRVCILPYGFVFFVETKRPQGGVLSKIQNHKLSEINDLGVRAYVAHTKDVIDAILCEFDKMKHHYDEAATGDL